MLIRGIYAVIVYDGIGMYLMEVYGQLGIPVVNILVDHSMTFVHCMSKPPKKYIQFSPDKDHVDRKYWNVENSFFLPHMGMAPVYSGGERPISLLFSGVCKSGDELMNKVDEVSLQEDELRDTLLNMIDNMLMDSTMTIEEACRRVLCDRRGYDPLPSEVAHTLEKAKPVDLYVRMYYRTKVIRTILDHGIDITVIGGDGKNLICPPTLIFIGFPLCLLLRHFNI